MKCLLKFSGKVHFLCFEALAITSSWNEAQDTRLVLLFQPKTVGERCFVVGAEHLLVILASDLSHEKNKRYHGYLFFEAVITVYTLIEGQALIFKWIHS